MDEAVRRMSVHCARRQQTGGRVFISSDSSCALDPQVCVLPSSVHHAAAAFANAIWNLHQRPRAVPPNSSTKFPGSVQRQAVRTTKPVAWAGIEGASFGFVSTVGKSSCARRFSECRGVLRVRCLAMYITHAFLFFKFYLETFCKEFRSGETTFLLLFHIFACVGVVKLVVHEHAMRLFAEVRIFCLPCSWRHEATAPLQSSSTGVRVCLSALADDTSLRSRGSRHYVRRPPPLGSSSVQGLSGLQVSNAHTHFAS